MQMQDKLTLDAPKRTKDGFMAVRAKACRSGVYDYLGSEVDPTGAHFKADQIVKVYRPEDEVFDRASIHSFISKPITDNHPPKSVTADNFRKYGRGVVMGAVRDGEHLAFDLVLMDADMISAVDAGKRELSNGYSCELVIGDGVAPDGTAFNITQKSIRGNHVAVVDKGRAGPDCRISDSASWATCDAIPDAAFGDMNKKERPMKIMLDGLHVDLSDADAVKAAFDKKDAALVDSAKALETSDAAVATLTAEKAALEKKVTDAESVDMDQLVADRAALVASAKSIKSDIVTDGKSSDEIRKLIVDAELGDVAKDFDAKQVAAAFAVIAKDGSKEDRKVVPLIPQHLADTANIRDAVRASRNVA